MTIKLFLIASLAIATRGRALAWISICFSISDRWEAARSIATRTTWESVPCSAWDKRSDATKTGLDVLSAMT